MSKPTYCRTCEQQIQWTVTAAGRNMPLDVEVVDPTTKGAQIAFRQHGRLQSRPLDVACEDIARMIGCSTAHARDLITDRVYEAHLSHFSTCPHGDFHRSRRRPPKRVDKP